MSVGPWQVVLILVVILVLFGAGKLPSVMKDLAKGVQAFKKGLRDEEDGTEGDATDSQKKDVPALEAQESPAKENPADEKEDTTRGSDKKDA